MRVFSLILAFLICPVWAIAGPSSVPPWVEPVSNKEKEPLSVAQRIEEVLKRETMLSPEDKAALENLLKESESKDISAENLETISKAFRKRITRDLERARSVIDYLGQLQKNDYLRRIGQVKAHEIKKLRDRYQALSAAVQSTDIWPVEKKQSIQRLFEILSAPTGDSIASVWRQEEKAVTVYYPSWNKKLQELRNLEKEAGRGKTFPSSVLGFDEKGFIKSFGDLQALLRRVTPAKSGGF